VRVFGPARYAASLGKIRWLACHIAGKALKTVDRHRSWALAKARVLDLDEFKGHSFKLAQLLRWPVEEARKEVEASTQTQKEPKNGLMQLNGDWNS